MAPRKTTKPKPPIKAFGRSLSDFPKLTIAEKILIEGCRKGDEVRLGEGSRPTHATPHNKIRASLIRFLALGGDEQTAVDIGGIKIKGAWIEGELDLSGCESSKLIKIINSKLPGNINLRDGRFKSFNMGGSHIQRLDADRAIFSGSIFLRNGFVASGQVRLFGCQITGNLDCSNARFVYENGDSLSLDSSSISGNVSLSEAFHASGPVSSIGSKIGGDLSCIDGVFANEDSQSLSLERTTIGGALGVSGILCAGP